MDVRSCPVRQDLSSCTTIDYDMTSPDYTPHIGIVRLIGLFIDHRSLLLLLRLLLLLLLLLPLSPHADALSLRLCFCSPITRLHRPRPLFADARGDLEVAAVAVTAQFSRATSSSEEIYEGPRSLRRLVLRQGGHS